MCASRGLLHKGLGRHMAAACPLPEQNDIISFGPPSAGMGRLVASER